MAATYLVRFDDLCPSMNWLVWRQVEETLQETGVKPILAVVPDNRDANLNIERPDPRFWVHVREWQSRGWTIGLHGYQHRYVTKDPGIMGRNRYSEFAGLPRDVQAKKLRTAVAIFQAEGVTPEVWIAPAHSFDAATLVALAECGIRRISDGYSVLPHTDAAGMTWVPQQLGEFRWMPAGVWTVCMHHNRWNEAGIRGFRTQLQRYQGRIGEWREVVEKYSGRNPKLADRLSAESMRLARSLRIAFSQ
jgi:predicted deacetylase